jgi:hypothetical protein
MGRKREEKEVRGSTKSEQKNRSTHSLTHFLSMADLMNKFLFVNFR